MGGKRSSMSEMRALSADFDLLEMLGTHVGAALVATRGSISPA
jgi:hypothetical protein